MDKRLKSEEIIAMLREVEVRLAPDEAAAHAARDMGYVDDDPALNIRAVHFESPFAFLSAFLVWAQGLVSGAAP